jgi:hypothetical protein
MVAVFVTALAIRLVYNLFVHPPLEFRTSDMAGYLRRADKLLDTPWSTVDPLSTFFPYGTHVLVFITKWTFGRDNGPAIGVVFAVLGALTACFWYATARRLLGAGRTAVRVLAVLFVAHAPLVLQGGFVLSEVPFACALAASAFFAIRLYDEGRWLDALAMGVAFALGMTFRPQMLVSLGLVIAVLLLRPSPALPSALRRGARLALALAPVAVVCALSAARMHHHTGKLGLVSTNAGFNFAFGRCHCNALSASKTRASKFEPPSFNNLRKFEEKHGVAPIFELDPAIDLELEIKGKVWDQTAAMDLARSCVAKSGAGKQVKYAATHVLLLWAYNLPWPTKGVTPNIWAFLQVLWIPGALVALGRSLRKAYAREALAAVHVWALFITAILFFGEARLRVPYDGFLMILAVWVYAPWIVRLREARSRRKQANQPTITRDPATSSPAAAPAATSSITTPTPP